MVEFDPIFATPERIKIVFLGNANVGKTSIINRWMFGQYNNRITPTIGIAQVQKTVNHDGTNLNVIVCDTAGEERYQSLCGNFLRGADCVIIVASYDIPSSCEAINSWCDLVKDKCEAETGIVIAINKKDTLSDPPIIHNDEYEVFSISALTGDTINEVFMEAIQQGYQSHCTTSLKKTTPIPKKNEKKCSC